MGFAPPIDGKIVRASCDSTVSWSLGSMLILEASSVMPPNMEMASTAIQTRVVRAFLASGGLKAGTPSAIASTPVSAVQPWVNALSNRKRVIASAPVGTTWLGGTYTIGPPKPN